jgi:hypothetical protein
MASTMSSNVRYNITAPPAADDYVTSIKKAIIFSGGMTMKSVNLYTGIVTWRDRFIVVTRGALSYYGDAKDVYNVEAESIGEINLINILQINTCGPDKESRCAPRCAFELRAFVTKGGDSDDTRTFVFEARTPELCKQWMEQICAATGKFALKPHAKIPGFFFSEESEELRREQAQKRSETFAADASVLQRKPGAGGGTGRGGGGAGAGGRGGAGRGAAFAQGKISTLSAPPPLPSSGPSVEEEEEAILAAARASEIVPPSSKDLLHVSAPSAGRGGAGGAGGAGAAGRGGRGGRGFAAPQRRASTVPPSGL